jgi:hypothetical protein
MCHLRIIYTCAYKLANFELAENGFRPKLRFDPSRVESGEPQDSIRFVIMEYGFEWSTNRGRSRELIRRMQPYPAIYCISIHSFSKVRHGSRLFSYGPQ